MATAHTTNAGGARDDSKAMDIADTTATAAATKTIGTASASTAINNKETPGGRARNRDTVARAAATTTSKAREGSKANTVTLNHLAIQGTSKARGSKPAAIDHYAATNNDDGKMHRAATKAGNDDSNAWILVSPRHKKWTATAANSTNSNAGPCKG